jgi:hypothetical protein
MVNKEKNTNSIINHDHSVEGDLGKRQFCTNRCVFLSVNVTQSKVSQGKLFQGRIQRGAHPARAPPKIGKNMIFWRKIVIFHTKYPTNFRASLRNWKKYDFLS